ncbi:unnamed protein product [Gongylonema pulchrum]|uniref:Midasin n=1 Tax=Gongylonema pulchrum TaxID=637853 RepID=A0A3P7MP99_9BILA|nr:unnamed protein product [Gongylonema pulchrum]
MNNHEHTDLQEYIGSYVPDGNGRFVFVEGPLVKAARDGYWIILDELNLAPTDVIEALNRLLDDNRELYVAETNTVVKAHPQFRLFATQNPVGLYAGRKRLSRALLNRFIVLRFDQLPYEELAQMVVVSCGIAPSAANAMVSVFVDLRAQRSTFGVFSARDGLMTLRDLFKWAHRLSGSDQTDWRQSLAEHGFFLLGARCRNVEDLKTVKRTLEKNLKREIDIKRLFSIDSPYLPDEFCGRSTIGTVVLADTIRIMLILVAQCWRFSEPALIVGETGCGKTTVAQIIAKEKLLALNCHERTEAADFLGSLRPCGGGTFRWMDGIVEKLLAFNCHERTEAADFLGSLRPCGGGTFRWMDGIVVQAMKEGRPLLIDEISLAPDSVLERLNPLLEQSRSLFLNDAGTASSEVRAMPGFNVVATMNPGGDHGKKELSRALRNRFTEIWCSPDVSGSDLTSIVNQVLSTSSALLDENELLRSAIANCIVQFVLWFGTNFSHALRSTTTIRDVVAIAQHIAATLPRLNSPASAIYHAFSATLFDAIGTVPTRASLNLDILTKQAVSELSRIMQEQLGSAYDECFLLSLLPIIDQEGPENFVVGDFHIPFGPAERFMPKDFTLARGLTLDKPILLEGPPGCGKSSTVVALAAITGHPLTRLNLSEQTVSVFSFHT